MTEKKTTASNGDGKRLIVAKGNRWWHLQESAATFRQHAQYSPEIRAESAAMAEHLALMQRDPDYRAAVLGGLESYLDGNPKRRPVSLRQRHARDFLEYVRASLTYQGDDDLRGTVERLLVAAVAFDPLILGDSAPPIADVLDEAEHSALQAIKRSTKRNRAEFVARALLRAIGVDSDTVRKLYP